MHKVYQEIARRQSQGKAFLPLHSPQSISGHEMFGFLSPHFIQAIEALDPNHQCLEYWNNKLSLKEEYIYPIISMNCQRLEAILKTLKRSKITPERKLILKL